MLSSQSHNRFSDATIRQFLLAQLSQRERSAFEEALFTNAQLERRVRLAEIELTDEYAFGRLRGAETKLFERNFLCTADRARLLSASRALRARFENDDESTPAFGYWSVASLFRLRHPKLRYAFAVVLAALLLATFWVVVKKEPQIKQEIAKRLPRRGAIAQPTPVEVHHATNTAAPEHQETPQLLPEHGAENWPLLTIHLEPRSDRPDAPSFAIPSGDGILQFVLAVKDEAEREYSVEIVKEQGESVYNTSAHRTSSSTVTVEATAQLLKTGQYELRLLNASSKAVVATYYFRVE